MKEMTSLVALLLIAFYAQNSDAHGRLIEPPSRASMFRYGFNNPPDYQDNEGFCGGASHQQNLGGLCGICGDPWDGVREHEAGGRYANGIIVRTYERGQVVGIKVEITAHHKGFFEFRLCPNNDVTRRATPECLNQNVLWVHNDQAYKYMLPLNGAGIYDIDVQLPDHITCTQCVLQWRYHTGNSWGTDPDGTSCVGCGFQEEFYACADIAITEDGTAGLSGPVPAPVPQPAPAPAAQPAPAPWPAPAPASQPRPAPAPQPASAPAPQPAPAPSRQPATGRVCYGIGVFAGGAFDTWCTNNCSHVPSFCPSTLCRCV